MGDSETFISDDGVFSKDTLDFGSRALLETVVQRDLTGKLLDLGCGIGYMGIMLKKHFPDLEVTMIDINETAVQLAKENSVLYAQDNACICGDGLSAVDSKFDVIVFNPPIRTGKHNIYRLFREGVDHLNPDGIMYVVIRKQQGAESAVSYLGEIAEVQIIEKKKGYWILAVCN